MIEPSENWNSDVDNASVYKAEDDPLLCKVSLHLVAIFHPLGFAVEIATNSEAILDAAWESWGHLRSKRAAPMLRLRIYVSDSGPDTCPPAPVARAHRHLLSIVANAQNQALCDLEDGSACAWLSRTLLRHRSYLRYHFIEASALVLISARYATPIHAACVSRHNLGLLLCGDSGAGKSSLAYACARAGWTYTSDDASYLLSGTDPPRIVGNSHQMRFRPSARELFPEFQGLELTPRTEGKPSIEVPTARLSGIITSEETEIRAVVFLRREACAKAELASFSMPMALQRFQKDLHFTDVIQKVRSYDLERLLNAEMYELHYSDLAEAVEQLGKLIRSLSERPK